MLKAGKGDNKNRRFGWKSWVEKSKAEPKTRTRIGNYGELKQGIKIVKRAKKWIYPLGLASLGPSAGNFFGSRIFLWS